MSRIVTELIRRGYVSESRDSEDNRIRLLNIVDGHPLAQGFEVEARALLADFMQAVLNERASSGD